MDDEILKPKEVQKMLKCSQPLIYKMAAQGTPFFFLIDFECIKPVIMKIEDAAAHGIHFNLNGIENSVFEYHSSHKNILFEAQPVAKEIYDTAFQSVKRNILHGNSYLLNLTFPSGIDTNLGLEEIFHRSRSKYKLLKSNEFVVFSPT